MKFENIENFAEIEHLIWAINLFSKAVFKEFYFRVGKILFVIIYLSMNAL